MRVILYLLKFASAFFTAFVLTISVVNGQAPVANFTATPLSGCSPMVVQFQDMSTGNPTGWLWNFGNGNTSELKNPGASYLSPGKYTVTLTVKNANGTNTLVRSQYITVAEPPAIDFSASATTGCFPLQIQFTDNSTAGSSNTNTSWFWDFGDGTTSTDKNPAHTYTTAGSFAVTLRVTNDKGCSRTITRPNYITTTPGIRAGFTNTLPGSCQPPANITFTNTSTGPGVLSYQWDFGDGATSTDRNPSHTYTTIGLYNVTLTVSNDNGCSTTIVKNNLIPVGQFNPSFNKPDSICVNMPVKFTNTSAPVPSSQTWDFGDGTTSTASSPVKTYTTTGTYTVKLNAKYGSCSDTATSTIVVVGKPFPDFSAPVVAACQPPFNVNFRDQSPNATSWLWKFGDGSTSTEQNPVHTYTDFGNYNVTLIVTNGAGCTDSVTKMAFIKIRKTDINIPSLPASGCIPLTINPVATINAAGDITSYLWDFGDGTTSTSPNPSHTYSAQGTYTVRLYITTSGGCTDSLVIADAVHTGSKPVADFSTNPVIICASNPAHFTNLSTAADSLLWNFGDGAMSVAQNPSHQYSATGTFTVSLVISNNGCRDTIIKPDYITVRPPISKFNIIPHCDNRLQFSFTDQSEGPVTTWQWNFGDGTTSDGQNPVHDFPALGNYNVTLTTTTEFAPGDQCTYSLTKTVHAVDENPDFTVSPNPGCKGSPVTFTGIVDHPSNIRTYSWSFGDGIIVSSGNPSVTHSYANPGTYTIRLITTDINNCTDTIIKNNFIRINGPTAGFSATNTAGCKGLNVLFNDQSVTDGINAITNWQWNFGDGTVQNYSAGPFRHIYSNVGVYSVKLKVTDASGCSDSLTLENLVITTDPVPAFKSVDTLTCPGALVNFSNTSTAVNYSSVWDFGDGTTSATNSPAHNYSASGLYTVKLKITDQYGCPDSLTKTSFIKVDDPVARFTISDSVTSCVPFRVQFNDSSSYYTSLLWNFGDGGTSTLPDPSHFYNLAGTFSASLIVTSPGGCKDTAYKTIAVYDTAGSVIIYNPLGGCRPKAVTFSAFTSGPVNYLWDFGDGNTITTTEPAASHVYTFFGDYIPTVIMQDPSGCLIPISGISNIHITGSTSKFGLSRNLLCDSGYINFIDSTTFNDPLTNWNWDFGDGTTSTLQHPSHLYTVPGVYTISLNTITQAGCRDTATLTDALKVVLSPSIRITGDSVACINNSLTQQGVFVRTDTSVVTWLWNFPNGNTSNLQNPASQTYTTAGNFAITAIATNSDGCKDTATKNIVINPLPVVDMPGTITTMAGSSVTIPATYSPNTATWEWQPRNGLSCTNCPQPVAGPQFSTTYHVAFVDSNGCRNTGSIDIIVVCKDGNIFVPNTFSPNKDGNNDIFYPRGKGIDRVQVLRVFNRWGEVVFEKTNIPVNDAGYGWDGTYKGKEPQPGVYIYQVEVYCTNGELIKFAGNVALIL